MSGIVFLPTNRLEELESFYTERLGLSLVERRGGCPVFRAGNLLLGFCPGEPAEKGGQVVLEVESRERVVEIHERLRDLAESEPATRGTTGDYFFQLRDPEGRRVVVTRRGKGSVPLLAGDELLLKRRSIRRYRPDPVPAELLEKVLENTRQAPSSNNRQPWYFLVIRNGELISRLGALRPPVSAPIAAAPLAVAVCADPALSRRYLQDGPIVTYHLMLAARFYGLGTCWIAGLDETPGSKELLGIPEEHYLVTVTPLGFPAEAPRPKERKPLEQLVRVID